MRYEGIYEKAQQLQLIKVSCNMVFRYEFLPVGVTISLVRAEDGGWSLGWFPLINKKDL